MAKARVRWRLTPFSAPINPSVICSIPQLWFCFYLSEVHEKKKGTERPPEVVVLCNTQDAGKPCKQMSHFCSDKC